MNQKYSSIDVLLEQIDEPNRSGCKLLLQEHRKLFQVVQGSTNNHQNWSGGYFDHIQEVMNIAVVLYSALNQARPLEFSLSDALLIVYLHDLEKPWKYELKDDGQLHELPEMKDKSFQIEFRMEAIKKYGIELTPEQENAMRYVEGEGKDYSSRRRVAGPLAAFCHLCDVTSARIWFNNPLNVNDPWLGASRVRDS
jgi:hypothetical protein